MRRHLDFGTLACAVCSIALLAGGLRAQDEVDPAEIGFVRLVNLAGAGTGNTRIAIDGNVMWEKGYVMGQRTGGIGFKRGVHKFVVTKEGCKNAEKSIMMDAGKTQTLVSYAEPIRDEDGEIVGWALKVERLELGNGDVIAEISCQGSPLTTLNAQENGNYVVMIFENGDQGKKAISFYDPKFVMAN